VANLNKVLCDEMQEVPDNQVPEGMRCKPISAMEIAAFDRAWNAKQPYRGLANHLMWNRCMNFTVSRYRRVVRTLLLLLWFLIDVYFTRGL
jgi:hypothetical protein